MDEKENQINGYNSSFGGELVKEGFTDFHHYRFVKSSKFGMCLFLDGIIQSSARDQNVYHLAMVSQALANIKSPKNILIIGGAGGGLLHQLLKSTNKSIERIEIVDIDQKLFEIAPIYMKGWCQQSELQDPRVNITFQNGVDYLRNTKKRYDTIFFDVSDPLEITKSNEMYTEAVFKDVLKVLYNGGVLVYHSAPFAANGNVFHRCYENNMHLLGHYHGNKEFIGSFEGIWIFNVIQKKEL
jgi:spermidine synthase